MAFRPDKNQEEGAADWPITAAVSCPLVDWAGLEAQYSYNPGFVDRLAGVALSSRAKTPAELRLAAAGCAEGDYGQAAFLAHALKGIGANLKAVPLWELAGRTEDAARQRQPEAAGLARELAAALEAVQVELAARLQAADGKDSPA